jgi:hypothetical protein
MLPRHVVYLGILKWTRIFDHMMFVCRYQASRWSKPLREKLLCGKWIYSSESVGWNLLKFWYLLQWIYSNTVSHLLSWLISFHRFNCVTLRRWKQSHTSQVKTFFETCLSLSRQNKRYINFEGYCEDGTIHYMEITLQNQLNVLIIWCLYADFMHLGDQNHREKSCYVATELIALSFLLITKQIMHLELLL